MSRIDDLERIVHSMQKSMETTMQAVAKMQHQNLTGSVDRMGVDNELRDAASKAYRMSLDDTVMVMRHVHGLAALVHANNTMLLSMAAAFNHVIAELGIDDENIPLDDEDRERIAQSLSGMSRYMSMATEGEDDETRAEGERLVAELFNGFVPTVFDDEEEADLMDLDDDDMEVGVDEGSPDGDEVAVTIRSADGTDLRQIVGKDLGDIVNQITAGVKLDEKVAMAQVELIDPATPEGEDDQVENTPEAYQAYIIDKAVKMAMNMHDVGKLSETAMRQLIAVFSDDAELLEEVGMDGIPLPGRISQTFMANLSSGQKRFTVLIRDENDLKEALMAMYVTSMMKAGLGLGLADSMQLLYDTVAKAHVS